jgi:hypothetical protein
LAHQKLLASKIGCAELARMTGSSKPSALEWIRKGSKPKQEFQDSLRAQLGIQWADWERKPAPQEPITDEERSAAVSVEMMRPAQEPSEEVPDEPDPPEGQELESTLREVRKSRREAQRKGIATAAASLLAQESRLVEKLTEQRERQYTERQRIMTCLLLRGMYRCAVDVLRPAMGDDWSEAVKRISALWDQLDDSGNLPEGVTSDGD